MSRKKFLLKKRFLLRVSIIFVHRASLNLHIFIDLHQWCATVGAVVRFNGK